MIVFDLACPAGHRFESWFRDGAAYDEQAEAGAIACPVCGATNIAKAPTRLNIGRGGSRGDAPPSAATPPGPTLPPPLAAALTELRRRVEENCDDVGRAFPEEARRIHYGEAANRGIYGEASADDAKALADEGIDVQPMPWFRRRDG